MKKWKDMMMTDAKSSRVYDHSLPHSRLITGDVEGEWRTRAPTDPTNPLEPLLAATPRLRFRPACGPAGRRIPRFCNIFIFISCSSFISKLRLSMKWVVESFPMAVT
ncbi:unnamed protein product [Spirodela intermedia]|uniref:Uncharacterized protein n=1 Tax=Spirodela intermedia TaxID=51605 RepID=A0ABN7EA91_SPIIN|nr:unnamed protein product [Spirodela intermedia]